jgi:hypothetical protein
MRHTIRSIILAAGPDLIGILATQKRVPLHMLSSKRRSWHRGGGGGYRTIRVTDAWRTKYPEVPVTVTMKVPRGVEEMVRSRSVELPGEATGLGVNVAEAPAGRPVTESETLPVKPPTDPTETVYVAVWPRETVTDDGLALSVKSRGVTTSVIVAERVIEPLVPVTVRE